MKKILLIGLVIILSVGLIGCSDDELVLEDIEAIDSETIEVTFDDGKGVEITDFTPSPLKTGENEIKFEYDGVSYEGIVAYGITDEQYFEFSNSIIRDYDEEGGSDVVIPSEINGVKVKGIRSGAFDADADGEWFMKPAFFDKGLTSVKIPDSVEKIGSYTFWGDDFEGDYDNPNKLEQVELGDSVNEIGNRAFAGNELTEVEIPDSVEKIGHRAFRDNKLEQVKLGDSVIKIDSLAFDDNELTEVEIPDSVEEISGWAFSGNNLESVEIPNSVNEIGNRAFAGNKLTEVEIPDSVEKIDWHTFRDNEITELEIGDSVEKIGEWAFARNNLTSVEIPDSVTKIGHLAFLSNELTEIVMTADVELETWGGNDLMGEGTEFKDFYNNQDKEAGTYVREDLDSDWELQ